MHAIQALIFSDNRFYQNWGLQKSSLSILSVRLCISCILVNFCAAVCTDLCIHVQIYEKYISLGKGKHKN